MREHDERPLASGQIQRRLFLQVQVREERHREGPAAALCRVEQEKRDSPASILELDLAHPDGMQAVLRASRTSCEKQRAAQQATHDIDQGSHCRSSRAAVPGIAIHDYPVTGRKGHASFRSPCLVV